MFSSCDKTDDISVKKNWIFTISVVTTSEIAGEEAEPAIETQEVENLTKAEAEAEAEAKAIEVAGTVSINGVNLIKTTVTITEKK